MLGLNEIADCMIDDNDLMDADEEEDDIIHS
jgi:hypothetical protein